MRSRFERSLRSFADVARHPTAMSLHWASASARDASVLASEALATGASGVCLATDRGTYVATPEYDGWVATSVAPDRVEWALEMGLDLGDAVVAAGSRVDELWPVQTRWPHTDWSRLGVPDWFDDLPGDPRPPFPTCGDTPLGLYPIVDSRQWVARLLELGVDTIQLRCKDLRGDALRAEVQATSELCRAAGARLFINDFWRLAIEVGTYGVHLGQSDIDSADIPAIRAAGLRLGLSTHCFREVARAAAWRPSYLAMGPIFPTTAKPMPFGPQGLERLAAWRRLLSVPLVAIGGIGVSQFSDVLRTGVDSIAMISAITQAADPDAAATGYLEHVGRWFSDRG